MLKTSSDLCMNTSKGNLFPENISSQMSDEELEKLSPWNPECKEALDELFRKHQDAIFDAM